MFKLHVQDALCVRVQPGADQQNEDLDLRASCFCIPTGQTHEGSQKLREPRED